MGLRITPSILYRSALADVARQRQALAETQEKATTGLSINRPSDDPSGAGTAMLMRSAIGAVEQFQRVNSGARARVESAESAIANANDIVIRARELAVQGSNGAQGAESREQIAREIETLHRALLAEANARQGGGALFAGFANDSAPFEATGSFVDAPPSAPTVSFVGDSNMVQIQIDQNETVDVTFDGRRIFMGDADGDGTPEAGREDLFELLGDLRNALISDDQAAVGATISRFDTAMDQLSSERTRVGASITQLERASDRLAQRQVTLEERLSNLQDADFAEVVSDLVQQEAALQAGLAATARLLQPTLLDALG